MHFRSVQFEAQVHIFFFIFFTSLSEQSYQGKSKKSVPLALLHNEVVFLFLFLVRAVRGEQ